MVRIRLARAGAKDKPFYHITVADQRFARDARFIERIGYYNPIAKGKQKKIVVELEKFNHWVSKGAQPSERVLSIIKESQQQPV